MGEIKPKKPSEIASTPVSKTKADEAAHELCREIWPVRGVPPTNEERATECMLLMLDFTAAYTLAIESVFNTVKAIVLRVSPKRVDLVTSRMKTLGAITRKLRRNPSRLSQLQDIAGCRVVLEDHDEVREVLAAIVERWPDSKVVDRIDGAPRTGYRAIHVIVEHDGYPVEIQLRTRTQQRWADAVEEFAGRFGLDGDRGYLKDGDAPEFIVDYFEVASRILAERERGRTPNAQLEARLSELREEVRQYVRDFPQEDN